MDDGIGLINMNARLYDPTLGRFISPDPIVAYPDSSQGFNRYTYGENNPLSYVDPDGHISKQARSALGGLALMFLGGWLISWATQSGGIGLLFRDVVAFPLSRAEQKLASLAYSALTSGVSLFNAGYTWATTGHLPSFNVGGSVEYGGEGQGLINGRDPYSYFDESFDFDVTNASAAAHVLGATIGEYYYFDSSGIFQSPTGNDLITRNDSSGNGNIFTCRDGCSRTHLGRDYVVGSGVPLYAPSDGAVYVRSGIVYNQNNHIDGAYFKAMVFRVDLSGMGVLRTNLLYASIEVKYFYAEARPGLRRNSVITGGSVVGSTQDLNHFYYGMTQHLHVEVRLNGYVRSPAGYLIPVSRLIDPDTIFNGNGLVSGYASSRVF